VVGFRAMSQQDAVAIATWRYPPPYDFYDADADADDLAELLDPRRREGRYFSAWQDGALIGFAHVAAADGTADIGLGLRPDLTGRGLGSSFLDAVMAFARERQKPVRFTLSVAAFNQRAIRVYERAGFAVSRRYRHFSAGKTWDFLEMTRPEP
jgi:[ribosomal protein S18]-alanine N-acetyltransferase